MPLAKAWRSARRLAADATSREIVSGSAVAFACKIAAAALSFGFALAVARLYGVEGVGLYGLALTLSSLVGMVATLGLDLNAVKLVAAGRARDDWASVRGVAATSVLLVAAASGACAVLLSLAAPLLSGHVFAEPGLAPVLSCMGLAAAVTALARLSGGLLRGLHEVIRSQMVLSAIGPAVALAVLLALSGGFTGAPAAGSVERAAQAYAVGWAVAAAAGLVWWRLALRGRWGWRDFAPPRPLLASGIFMSGSAVGAFLTESVPLILIGWFASAGEVGLFRAAWQVVALFTFLSVALETMVSPRVSSLFAQGQVGGIASVARLASLLTVAAAAPLILACLAAPAWVLGLFGPEFTSAATVLQVLVAGRLVNLALGVTGTILVMTGHERASMAQSAMGVALVTTLSLALIPQYGALGGAVAASAAMAARAFAASYLVYRFHGFLVPFGGRIKQG